MQNYFLGCKQPRLILNPPPPCPFTISVKSCIHYTQSHLQRFGPAAAQVRFHVKTFCFWSRYKQRTCNTSAKGKGADWQSAKNLWLATRKRLQCGAVSSRPKFVCMLSAARQFSRNKIVTPTNFQLILSELVKELVIIARSM